MLVPGLADDLEECPVARPVLRTRLQERALESWPPPGLDERYLALRRQVYLVPRQHDRGRDQATVPGKEDVLVQVLALPNELRSSMAYTRR